VPFGDLSSTRAEFPLGINGSRGHTQPAAGIVGDQEQEVLGQERDRHAA
jgi:hypothetical protein